MNKIKMITIKWKYIVLLLPVLGAAQIPVSLETAYDKAMQNNLTLKTGQQRIDYQDKIKKSYLVIDPLNINAEIGQMNSAYVDNALSVNQTLRMPKFYESQKQLLMEEWKNALLTLDVQKWQLKKEIALVYNNLNYLDEKQNLLKKADSIFTSYYRRSELRLKAGESNILEKTTAENYRSQAEIQLQNLMKDRDVSLYQFNYLINDNKMYTNQKGNFYNTELFLNENFSGNPLILKQYEQQKNIENAKLEAETAKLLPSFNVGFNSTTMKGVGSDDKYYNGTHRFQSGMIGVGLPVFNAAQKSVIEGQKINKQIAENNYQIAVRNLQNQHAKTIGEYQKLKSETDYYRTKGLQNAQTIIFTAELLSKEGEIDYLEYTMLVNQSLEIQNKYIDAQKLLNEKIIELNALNGN